MQAVEKLCNIFNCQAEQLWGSIKLRPPRAAISGDLKQLFACKRKSNGPRGVYTMLSLEQVIHEIKWEKTFSRNWGKILLAHRTLDFSDRNALKLAYKEA
jgi:hypothetical protein